MNSKNKLHGNFNDIIAKKAEWILLNTASSTFDPRKAICVNSQRIEFRTTWFSRLFLGIFVIVGIGGLLIHKAYVFFIFMGLIGLYWSSFPIVFDKNKNVFRKGRRFNLFMFMDYIEICLSEIYAIQLIGGRISNSEGGDYRIYQINLINKDSKRLNVVYFSNKVKAKESAIMLKKFLNVELWDAT
ncbi:MAG: hypothetical protein ISR72_04820 [Methylobacter sp.]|nr:hypothetical protein [Methylobacter sp.]